MKKIISTAVVLLAVFLFGACSQEDFTSFDGEKAGIYMQRVYTTDINGTPISFTDSVVVTFANYKSDTEKLRLYVPVKIMGDVKDYDRKFNLRVNKELSTGVEGVDYEFRDTACYIPAGMTSTNVFFYIKKTDKLEKQAVRLVFQLTDNENFTAELNSYKSTVKWSDTGKQLCGTHYKVIFNNIWTIPTYWGWYGDSYFGTWTVAKEKVVNSVMGYEHSDWDSKVKYGTLPYIAKKTQKYLQEQANAGTPVRDEDGSYMQLVGSYRIDYSNIN